MLNVCADQGESNAGEYNAYAQQMRSLIAGWRQRWESPPQLKVRTATDPSVHAAVAPPPRQMRASRCIRPSSVGAQ